MRRLLVVLAGLVALGATGADARAGSWTYATLDANHYAGNSLSMRLDPQGLRRYAWWTILDGIVYSGDGLASETLPAMEPLEANAPEPAAAGPASPNATELLITYSVNLALGPDGSPWIARVRHDCFGNCTGIVQVNHRTPSGWTTELLGSSYTRPEIEVGADGRVHVAYSRPPGELRYWVRATDGIWTEEPVASSSYSGASMRLDATGTPYLAWVDGGRIVYAVRDAGGWQPVVVDSGGLAGPSLALSPAGEARVSYTAGPNSELPGLWYAEEGAGGWTRTRVRSADGGDSPWQYGGTLALDPAGDPFIAFNDQNGLDLRGASRKQGAWTVQDIDTYGNTGYCANVAFDASGHPLVAYQADATIGVRLATGEVIVGVEGARPPAALAIRALGPARTAGPLALEIASPVATRVSLRLLDVAGRALAKGIERDVPAGVSRIAWDAGPLAPGVCFVRARAARGAAAASRLIVVR